MNRRYGWLWWRWRAGLVGIALWVGAGNNAPSLTAQQVTPPVLAFTNTTVVDVAGGQLLRGQTVVVAGTRIQAVGSARGVQIPAGARVVNAHGKYLIPGLWDMHVHSWGGQEVLYRSFLATGVTGVREMSSPWLDSLVRWKREISAGTRVGPRLLITGPYLGDEAPAWGIKVSTPAAARRLVDSLQAAGADFIKHRLDEDRPESRAVFFAIASEAKRLGIPLVGHMPSGVMPSEASDSGQRSIEHVEAWLCYDTIYHNEPNVALTPNPTREQCAPVAARFRRNHTWVDVDHTYPTRPLCRDAALARYPDPLTNHPIHPWLKGAGVTFLSGPCAVSPARPARGWTVLPLIVGTDIMSGPLPFSPDSEVRATIAKAKLYHQSPVPHVLARLVAAGMTPLEALRAATLNPAEFLGAADSLGTIATGKLADLVLLDRNPLKDIWATTKIRAVVANGRYYDRAALDTLLAEMDRIILGR